MLFVVINTAALVFLKGLVTPIYWKISLEGLSVVEPSSCRVAAGSVQEKKRVSQLVS